MPKVRAHVLATGRVQGVFFRDTMRSLATQLNLTGWARNLPDGSVEAVIEGEREGVESLVRWCRQGPPAANVTEVDVTWGEFGGEFSSFFVRR